MRPDGLGFWVVSQEFEGWVLWGPVGGCSSCTWVAGKSLEISRFGRFPPRKRYETFYRSFRKRLGFSKGFFKIAC